VTAAWVAFVVITLPMLGIVQNGPQIATDRYAYHRTRRRAILAGAAFASIARRLAAPARIVATTAGAAVVVAVLCVLVE
jgi:hypothetical protein